MMTLGGDVVGGAIAQGNFVLTRMHARYGKTDLKDDLRFREAKPVTGGREIWTKEGLEYGAVPSEQNYFQARYAVRHWWTGPIRCKDPQRGVWGGPPDGNYQGTIAANKVAFAPHGQIALDQVIGRDLWEIGYKKARSNSNTGGGGGGFAKPPKQAQLMSLGAGVLGALGLLAFAGALARRRRR